MAWLGRKARLACAAALLGAACSGDGAPGGASFDESEGRPAPRLLGDPFCVEPPEVHGDLRTAFAFPLEGPQAWLTAATIDAQGRLFAAGTAVDAVRIGSTNVAGTRDGTSHPFMLALDPEGRLLWARGYAGSWVINTLRALSDGEIAAIGVTDLPPVQIGTEDVNDTVFTVRVDGEGKLTSPLGLPDVFVDPNTPAAIGPDGQVALFDLGFGRLAVFDTSGTLVWEKPAGGFTQGLVQLAFDASGDLVVSAAVFGPLDWVDPPLVIDGLEGVLARFDPTGGVRWLKRLGKDMQPMALSLGGGRIVSSVMFVDPAGEDPQKTFVIGLDAGDGAEPTVQWSRSFPVDVYAPTPTLVRAQPDGGAFIFGVVPPFADIGQGRIADGGAFLARADAAGAIVASAVYHSAFSGQSFPMALLVHDAAAYTVGGFVGAIDVGTGLLRTSQPANPGLLIAKVVPEPFGAPSSRCGSGFAPGALLGDPSPITPTMMALAGDTLALTTGTEVMTIPVTGGKLQTIGTSPAPDNPSIIALTADADTIYWADAGTFKDNGDSNNDGAIVAAPVAGGAPKPLVDKLAGVVAIAVGKDTLYYAVGPVSRGTSLTLGKLLSVPLAGGKPKLLASGYIEIGPLAVSPRGVLAVGRTATSGSLVLSTFSDDGTETPLAISDRRIPAMAADDKSAYWLDYSELARRPDGQLRAASLDGGASRLLVGSLSFPSALALAGGSLYFVQMRDVGSDLVRVPVAGGNPGRVAAGFGALGPLTTDGTRLAWVQRVDDLTWSLVVRKY